MSDSFASVRPEGQRYAAVIVVKDEAPLMLEWIAFHFAVGFDELIIYDNGSTDGTWELVSDIARRAPVRQIRWTSRSVGYQTEAYMHAMSVFGRSFAWMVFIDSDEFFAPVGHGSIAAFAEFLPDCDAVALNWAIFGSSGFQEPPDLLVIEAYSRRAEDQFGPNQHTKMMLRPSAAPRFVNPHAAEVQGACVAATGDAVDWYQLGITRGVFGLHVCRVNHYFTRSHADWRRKIARGNPNVIRSPAEFDIYDRNEVADPMTAELWGAATRSLMARLSSSGV